MKTTTENTFPKASVMRFADKIEYADGGVVSKQVLKNDAGNITLFAFDEEQGLAEHTAPFDALVQVLDGEADPDRRRTAPAENRRRRHHARRGPSRPASRRTVQDAADHDQGMRKRERRLAPAFSLRP